MNRGGSVGLRGHAASLLLYMRRAQQMRREERAVIAGNAATGQSHPRLFNLDLHIGVIADLQQELEAQNVALTHWSISAHNHLLPSRLSITDPVRWVNHWNWTRLDDSRIDRFQDRYGRFLRGFDGFVATYSPVFAELYRGLERPTLVVSATRYEAPYSDRPSDWQRFDRYLQESVQSGTVHLYANNRGDADYIRYFTGLDAPVVPSLCERTPTQFRGRSSLRVIQSRAANLASDVERESAGRYRSIRALGTPYRWEDLLDCEEVFVVPQNISTMTLFELATAGVPVAIPSTKWMKELVATYPGVLAELTFHQVRDLDVAGLPVDSPVNYRSDRYLDWWLERADFYNSALMPNVRVVNSVQELLHGETSAQCGGETLRALTETRNLNVAEARRLMISSFLSAL